MPKHCPLKEFVEKSQSLFSQTGRIRITANLPDFVSFVVEKAEFGKYKDEVRLILDYGVEYYETRVNVSALIAITKS